MLRGLPLTAVIPVRGGSKGIPGKNLYRLGSDTLLERAIKIACLSPYVDEVMVSTDDLEMYRIAKKLGANARSLRPAQLASDDAKTVDVVINLIETEPISCGWVLLLQVTSPLRNLLDLNSFCKAFEEASLDIGGAVSLVELKTTHPDKVQQIQGGLVQSYLGKEAMVARQLLPEVYALNGAFYLTDRETILSHKTFMHAKTLPFVMPDSRSINLDTESDLVLLSAMLERGTYSLEEY